jgi:UrcA family protein
MNNGFKIAIGSFLVTAAVLKAAPALSEPVQRQNAVVVETADLDLSTDAGRRQLDHRLIHAASEACGSPSDADLAGKNAARECRKDVLAKARARGDLLTAGAAEEKGILVAASR